MANCSVCYVIICFMQKCVPELNFFLTDINNFFLIIQIIQRELVAFPCQSGQTVLIVKYLGCSKSCECQIKVFQTGHCARTWLLFWWTTVRLQWRGLRRPWEGVTWWTEGSRLETRWRFCKTLLNRVPHSSRVWKDKTHTHAVPVEGKRAKNHVPHACKSIPASIWPLHTQVKYAACPIITC